MNMGLLWTALIMGSFVATSCGLAEPEIQSRGTGQTQDSQLGIPETKTSNLAEESSQSPVATLDDSSLKGPQLVWIEHGEFFMDAEPPINQRKVEVVGFWLGKYEVQQGEYLEIMQEKPSCYQNGLDFPVERVSFPQALEYCRRLTLRERRAGRLPEGWSYRLPTEVEWEYACRAGTTTTYSFGDSEKDLSKFGNYCDVNCLYREWRDNDHNDGAVYTAPVGSYAPNPWGLYDMHGNVLEWCVRTKKRIGPIELANTQASRGGSWAMEAECSAAHFANYQHPEEVHDDAGFRVALSRVGE